MNEREWRSVWTLMRAEGAIGAEPDRDRFVSPIHRDEVDVHVDEQIGLGSAAVQLDGLPVRRLAECRGAGGVLGVVGVEAGWGGRRGVRPGRRYGGVPPQYSP